MTQDAGGFVHLHTLSREGSHCLSVAKLEDVFKKASDLQMSAIAVTDESMGAISTAFFLSKKYNVKLIPGLTVYLKQPQMPIAPIVLLASSEKSYAELVKLYNRGIRDGSNKAVVTLDDLRNHNAGCICLSGGTFGPLSQAIQENHLCQEAARALILSLKEIFLNSFYIEISSNDLKRKCQLSNNEVNEIAVQLAKEMSVPIVVTSEIRYLNASDEKHLDCMLAIGSRKHIEDISRVRLIGEASCEICFGTGQVEKKKCPANCHKGIAGLKICNKFFLKSWQQMMEELNFLPQDTMEIARKNTQNIANMCSHPHYLESKSAVSMIPNFHVGLIDSDEVRRDFMWWSCKQPPDVGEFLLLKYLSLRFLRHYTFQMSPEQACQYRARVEQELAVLKEKKFCSYMLIVWDYVSWARGNGILVGPGRGSVCGSLVAFALEIHRIDPIKHDLIFERFIDVNRTSLPDIDVDFASSRRNEIFHYLSNKYGNSNVAVVSNLNRFTLRVAVRDICRALLLGGSGAEAMRISQGISKLIDEKRLKVPSDLVAYRDNENVGMFLRHNDAYQYLLAIFNAPRDYSTHAAGLVVSNRNLSEIVPLRVMSNRFSAIQYDKTAVEKFGLAKMDILGVDILDVIAETIFQAKQFCGEDNVLTLEQVEQNLEDAATYEMLQMDFMSGVFQLEGPVARSIAKQIKPKSIRDLMFVNALARPGVSQEDRDEFIRRRNGQKTNTGMAAIPETASLKNTYGISIFEEDMIRTVAEVAKWSYSKANQLRKLSSQSDHAKINEIKKEFIGDASINVGADAAELIWDNLVVPMSKYGFTASHATAYSVLTYASAYYKRHHCSSYFAALMNNKIRRHNKIQVENIGSIELMKKEAQADPYRIKIYGVLLNNSKKYYSARGKRSILSGYISVKGLSEEDIDQILRSEPYESIFDFLMRSKLKSNKVQILAKAGAFDIWGLSRKYVFDNHCNIGKESIGWQATQKQWSTAVKLNYEKEVYGCYMSGSVFDVFPEFFRDEYNLTANELQCFPLKSKVYVQGMIIDFSIHRSKRANGKEFGNIKLENLNGEILDVLIWPDLYEAIKPKIKPNVALRAMCFIGEFNGKRSLSLASQCEFYEPALE